MKLKSFLLILIPAFIIFPRFISPTEAFQKEKFYSLQTKKNIDVVKGEIVVKYKSSADKTVKASHARSISAVSKGGLNQLGIDVMKLPEGMSVESAVNYYKSLPDVEFAEPNFIRHASVIPDDTRYATQQWGVQRVDCPAAWDVIKASWSVIVAVIDTGVDYNHPDLIGSVDRINGYNFVAGNTNTMDDNGHGTHVSGIISAMTNNAAGVAGVSWGARILPIKVLDATGSGSTVFISSGIPYAVSKGAKIINMSLGGEDLSLAERFAVDDAYSKGVIIVAASGNGGSDGIGDPLVAFPAALDDVIAVGASGKDNKIAEFSNYGSEIDVVAPGIDIWSTVTMTNLGSPIDFLWDSSGYASSDGTSMATPFVSGVVALILAKDSTLTFSDVYEKITGSATDIPPADRDDFTGYGLINASGAVGYKVPVPQSTLTTVSYPNPFSPSKGQRADIYLSKNLKGTTIKTTIYNIAGEKIRTKQESIASHAEWDGKNDDGFIVSNGIYFYVIETDIGKAKGKLTLIK